MGKERFVYNLRMAEIEFDKVAFTYDGKVNSLDGVSLLIERGEFVCVVGPNGGGKSTLLKHLNGLLVPDSGTVHIAGISTSDKRGAFAARKHVGMVFQNPDDALVETLVGDDVAFGPRNLGLPADEIRQRVAKALADVELTGLERHDTVSLSGGQKQRVAIAGVLAMNPAVLALDEATAMLDPQGKADVVDLVRRLNEQGMTVIAATHSMENVIACDARVVAIAQGQIAFDGPAKEFFADEAALQDLQLQAPYSVRLQNALRAKGRAINAPLNASPEELADAILA